VSYDGIAEKMVSGELSGDGSCERMALQHADAVGRAFVLQRLLSLEFEDLMEALRDE
jgi:hypothetical protein